MSDPLTGTQVLGYVIAGAPAIAVAVQGLTNLFERKLTETSTARLVNGVNIVGLAATFLLLLTMLVQGDRHVPLDFGKWVEIPQFHFHLKLIFDRLSIPFVVLTFLLCGTIGSFAEKYLHREPGYHRFFMLYSLFVQGMILTACGGTIETLFIGWEFVGLASALLVAFFQERAMPVRNGLRVWAVYRVSDAALLMAAVVLHQLSGEGDFDLLLSVESWPNGHIDPKVAPWLGCLVGALLIVAAAGKSALVPFSGWLPRAMEGPTPSSAIFYGALSVHLGAFLLMRFNPILDLSPVLQWCTIAIGLATAFSAALSGRVQTDIKCALTYASLTQVGLIVAEIGMGWDYIPLVHLIGHACLRTLQFLRAPSLMHDSHVLENAVGGKLIDSPDAIPFPFAPAQQTGWYRFGLERGSWDAWLERLFVAPFLATFRTFNRWERRWTDWLNGLQAPSGPPSDLP